MIPAVLAELEPDHTVLDMCAAPGSKSMQILETMQYQQLQASTPGAGASKVHAPGVLVANDLDSKRVNNVGMLPVQTTFESVSKS